MAAQFYNIGRLTLHPHRELLDSGVPVAIGGRALDLLSVLAAAEGGVVSKDELLAQVWNATIVEENALQAQVSAARKALGNEAARLVTVHGRGYRLNIGSEIARGKPPELGRPAAGPVADAPAAADGGDTGDVRNASPESRQLAWTRRAAGAALLIAGGGVAITLATRSGHVPDPRALELYQRGQIIERGTGMGISGAAGKLYKQAVAIDPDFADAWGALGGVDELVDAARVG
jgi:DNA-binding winged helix-turn-helix (wHTH) protein